ncbi:hypothetical protein [Helicobacter canis]|uniref:hypothetical protein n=1 Tax=Helicobacter canis TaxID=29419 RepID=UPI000E0FBB3B|nr:hypothetical protein [Helicobacter canis]
MGFITRIHFLLAAFFSHLRAKTAARQPTLPTLPISSSRDFRKEVVAIHKGAKADSRACGKKVDSSKLWITTPLLRSGSQVREKSLRTRIHFFVFCSLGVLSKSGF